MLNVKKGRYNDKPRNSIGLKSKWNPTKQKNLKVLHLNVQSLRSKTLELEIFLKENDISIVCLNEHWLKSDESFPINGYKLISTFCREVNLHGGVSILVRENLVSSEVKAITNMSIEKDCELSSIHFHNTQIITVYRSPSSCFSNFLKCLELVLSKLQRNKTIIITGDFNVKFNTEDGNTMTLINLMESFGLRYTVYANTRGNACIDNIFTNLPNGKYCTTTVDLGISDHLGIVFCYSSSNNITLYNHRINIRPITEEGLYMLYNILQNVDWLFINDSSIELELKCEKFVFLISAAIENSFPLKSKHANTFTKDKLQWFTPELNNIRDTLNLLREINKTYPELITKSSITKYHQYYKINSTLLKEGTIDIMRIITFNKLSNAAISSRNDVIGASADNCAVEVEISIVCNTGGVIRLSLLPIIISTSSMLRCSDVPDTVMLPSCRSESALESSITVLCAPVLEVVLDTLMLSILPSSKLRQEHINQLVVSRVAKIIGYAISVKMCGVMLHKKHPLACIEIINKTNGKDRDYDDDGAPNDLNFDESSSDMSKSSTSVTDCLRPIRDFLRLVLFLLQESSSSESEFSTSMSVRSDKFGRDTLSSIASAQDAKSDTLYLSRLCFGEVGDKDLYRPFASELTSWSEGELGNATDSDRLESVVSMRDISVSFLNAEATLFMSLYGCLYIISIDPVWGCVLVNASEVIILMPPLADLTLIGLPDLTAKSSVDLFVPTTFSPNSFFTTTDAADTSDVAIVFGGGTWDLTLSAGRPVPFEGGPRASSLSAACSAVSSRNTSCTATGAADTSDLAVVSCGDSEDLFFSDCATVSFGGNSGDFSATGSGGCSFKAIPVAGRSDFALVSGDDSEILSFSACAQVSFASGSGDLPFEDASSDVFSFMAVRSADISDLAIVSGAIRSADISDSAHVCDGVSEVLSFSACGAVSLGSGSGDLPFGAESLAAGSGGCSFKAIHSAGTSALAHVSGSDSEALSLSACGAASFASGFGYLSFGAASSAVSCFKEILSTDTSVLAIVSISDTGSLSVSACGRVPFASGSGDDSFVPPSSGVSSFTAICTINISDLAIASCDGSAAGSDGCPFKTIPSAGTSDLALDSGADLETLSFSDCGAVSFGSGSEDVYFGDASSGSSITAIRSAATSGLAIAPGGNTSFTATGVADISDLAVVSCGDSAAGSCACSFKVIRSGDTSGLALVSGDDSEVLRFSACGSLSFGRGSEDLSFGDVSSGVSSFTASRPADISGLTIVSCGDSGLLSFSACVTVSLCGASGDLSFGDGSSGVSPFTAIYSADISDLAIVPRGDSGVLSLSTGGDSEVLSFSACDTVSFAGGSGDSEVFCFSACDTVSFASGSGNLSLGDASSGVSPFTAIRSADFSDLAVASGGDSGVLPLSACVTVPFGGGSGDLSFGATCSRVSSFTAIHSVDISDLAIVSCDDSGTASFTGTGAADISDLAIVSCVSFGTGFGDLSVGATRSSVSSFTAICSVDTSDLAAVSCGGAGVFSIPACSTVSFGSGSGDLSLRATSSSTSPFTATRSVDTSDLAIVSGGDSAAGLGGCTFKPISSADTSDLALVSGADSDVLSCSACCSVSISSGSGGLSLGDASSSVFSFMSVRSADVSDLPVVSGGGSGVFSIPACGAVCFGSGSGDLSLGDASSSVFSSISVRSADVSGIAIVSGGGSGVLPFSACGTVSFDSGFGDLSFGATRSSVSSFTAIRSVDTSDLVAVSCGGSGVFSIPACGTVSFGSGFGDLSFGATSSSASSLTAIPSVDISDIAIVSGGDSGVFSIPACGSGDLSLGDASSSVLCFKSVRSADVSDLVIVFGGDSGVFSLSACGTVSFGSGSGYLSFRAAVRSADVSDLVVVSGGDSGAFSFSACGTVSLGNGSGGLSFRATSTSASSFTAIRSVDISDIAIVSGGDSGVFSIPACGTVSFGSGSGDLPFGATSSSVSSFTAIRSADTSDLAIVAGGDSGVFSIRACGSLSFGSGSGDLSVGDAGSSVISFISVRSADVSDLVIVCGGDSGVFSLSACDTLSFGSGSGDLSFGAISSSVSSFTATRSVDTSDLAAVSGDDSGVLSIPACGTVSFGSDSGDFSLGAAGSTAGSGGCSFKAIPCAGTSDLALVSRAVSEVLSFSACGSVSFGSGSGDLSVGDAVRSADVSDLVIVSGGDSGAFFFSACDTVSFGSCSEDLSFGATSSSVSSFTEIHSVDTSDLAILSGAAGSGGCSFKAIPCAGTSDLALVSGAVSEVLSFSACGSVSFGSGSEALSSGGASLDASSFTAIRLSDVSGLAISAGAAGLGCCSFKAIPSGDNSDLAPVSDADSEVLSFSACCSVSLGSGSGDLSLGDASSSVFSFTSVRSTDVSGGDSRVFSFSACGTVFFGGGSGDISFGATSIGVSSFTAIRSVDISDIAIVSGGDSGVFSIPACGTASFGSGSGDLSFGATISSVSSVSVIPSVNTSDLAIVSGGGSGTFSIPACGTVSFGSCSEDLSFGATTSSVSSFSVIPSVNTSDLATVSGGASGIFSIPACGTVSFGSCSEDLSFGATSSSVSSFTAIHSVDTSDLAILSGVRSADVSDLVIVSGGDSGAFAFSACGTGSLGSGSGDLSFRATSTSVSSFTAICSADTANLAIVSGGNSEVFSIPACGSLSFGSGSGDLSLGDAGSSVISFISVRSADVSDLAIVSGGDSGVFSIPACGTVSFGSGSGDLSFGATISSVSSFSLIPSVNTSDLAIVSGGASGISSIPACGTVSFGSCSEDLSFGATSSSVSSFTAIHSVDTSDLAILSGGVFSIPACGTVSFGSGSGDFSLGATSSSVSSFTATRSVDTSDLAIVSGGDSGVFSIPACGSVPFGRGSGDLYLGDAGSSVFSFMSLRSADVSDLVIVSGGDSGAFAFSACGTVSHGSGSGDLSFRATSTSVSSFTAICSADTSNLAIVSGGDSEAFSIPACGSLSFGSGSEDLSLGDAGSSVISFISVRSADVSDLAIVSGGDSGVFFIPACSTVSFGSGSGDLPFGATISSVSSFSVIPSVNTSDLAIVSGGASGVFSIPACGTVSFGSCSEDLSFGATSSSVASFTAIHSIDTSDLAILSGGDSGVFSIPACGSVPFGRGSGDLSLGDAGSSIFSFMSVRSADVSDLVIVSGGGDPGPFAFSACGTVSLGSGSGVSFRATSTSVSSFTAICSADTSNLTIVSGGDSEVFSIPACGSLSFGSGSGDLSLGDAGSSVISFISVRSADVSALVIVSGGDSGVFSFSACGTVSFGSGSGNFSFGAISSSVSSFTATRSVNTSDLAIVSDGDSGVFSFPACGSVSFGRGSGGLPFIATSTIRSADVSDLDIVSGGDSGVFSFSACGTVSFGSGSGHFSFGAISSSVSSFTATRSVDTSDLAAVSGDDSGVFSNPGCGTVSFGSGSGDFSLGARGSSVSSFTATRSGDTSGLAIVSSGDTGVLSLSTCSAMSTRGGSGDFSVSAAFSVRSADVSGLVIVSGGDSGAFSFCACGTVSLGSGSGDLSFRATSTSVSSFTAIRSVDISDIALVSGGDSGVFSFPACGTVSFGSGSFKAIPSGDTSDLAPVSDADSEVLSFSACCSVSLGSGSGDLSLGDASSIRSADVSDLVIVSGGDSGAFSFCACGTVSLGSGSGDLSFRATSTSVSSFTAIRSVDVSDIALVSGGDSGVFSIPACGTVSFGSGSFKAIPSGDTSDLAPVSDADSGVLYFSACCSVSLGSGSGDLSLGDASSTAGLGGCSFKAIASGDTSDLAPVSDADSEVLSFSACCSVSPGSGSADLSLGHASSSVFSFTSVRSAGVSRGDSGNFSFSACGTVSFGSGFGDFSLGATRSSISSFTATRSVDTSDLAIVSGDGSEVLPFSACDTVSLGSGSGDLSLGDASSSVLSFISVGSADLSDVAIISGGDSGVLSFSASDSVCFGDNSGDFSFSAAGLDGCSFKPIPSADTSDLTLVFGVDLEILSFSACGSVSFGNGSVELSLGDASLSVFSSISVRSADVSDLAIVSGGDSAVFSSAACGTVSFGSGSGDLSFGATSSCVSSFTEIRSVDTSVLTIVSRAAGSGGCSFKAIRCAGTSDLALVSGAVSEDLSFSACGSVSFGSSSEALSFGETSPDASSFTAIRPSDVFGLAVTSGGSGSGDLSLGDASSSVFSFTSVRSADVSRGDSGIFSFSACATASFGSGFGDFSLGATSSSVSSFTATRSVDTSDLAIVSGDGSEVLPFSACDTVSLDSGSGDLSLGDASSSVLSFISVGSADVSDLAIVSGAAGLDGCSLKPIPSADTSDLTLVFGVDSEVLSCSACGSVSFGNGSGDVSLGDASSSVFSSISVRSANVSDLAIVSGGGSAVFSSAACGTVSFGSGSGDLSFGATSSCVSSFTEIRSVDTSVLTIVSRAAGSGGCSFKAIRCAGTSDLALVSGAVSEVLSFSACGSVSFGSSSEALSFGETSPDASSFTAIRPSDVFGLAVTSGGSGSGDLSLGDASSSVFSFTSVRSADVSRGDSGIFSFSACATASFGSGFGDFSLGATSSSVSSFTATRSVDTSDLAIVSGDGSEVLSFSACDTVSLDSGSGDLSLGDASSSVLSFISVGSADVSDLAIVSGAAGLDGCSLKPIPSADTSDLTLVFGVDSEVLSCSACGSVSFGNGSGDVSLGDAISSVFSSISVRSADVSDLAIVSGGGSAVFSSAACGTVSFGSGSGDLSFGATSSCVSSFTEIRSVDTSVLTTVSSAAGSGGCSFKAIRCAGTSDLALVSGAVSEVLSFSACGSVSFGSSSEALSFGETSPDASSFTAIRPSDVFGLAVTSGGSGSGDLSLGDASSSVFSFTSVRSADVSRGDSGIFSFSACATASFGSGFGDFSLGATSSSVSSFTATRSVDTSDLAIVSGDGSEVLPFSACDTVSLDSGSGDLSLGDASSSVLSFISVGSADVSDLAIVSGAAGLDGCSLKPIPSADTSDLTLVFGVDSEVLSCSACGSVSFGNGSGDVSLGDASSSVFPSISVRSADVSDLAIVSGGDSAVFSSAACGTVSFGSGSGDLSFGATSSMSLGSGSGDSSLGATSSSVSPCTAIRSVDISDLAIVPGGDTGIFSVLACGSVSFGSGSGDSSLGATSSSVSGGDSGIFSIPVCGTVSFGSGSGNSTFAATSSNVSPCSAIRSVGISDLAIVFGGDSGVFLIPVCGTVSFGSGSGDSYFGATSSGVSPCMAVRSVDISDLAIVPGGDTGIFSVPACGSVSFGSGSGDLFLGDTESSVLSFMSVRSAGVFDLAIVSGGDSGIFSIPVCGTVSFGSGSGNSTFAATSSNVSPCSAIRSVGISDLAIVFGGDSGVFLIPVCGTVSFGSGSGDSSLGATSSSVSPCTAIRSVDISDLAIVPGGDSGVFSITACGTVSCGSGSRDLYFGATGSSVPSFTAIHSVDTSNLANVSGGNLAVLSFSACGTVSFGSGPRDLSLGATSSSVSSFTAIRSVDTSDLAIVSGGDSGVLYFSACDTVSFGSGFGDLSSGDASLGVISFTTVRSADVSNLAIVSGAAALGGFSLKAIPTAGTSGLASVSGADSEVLSFSACGSVFCGCGSGNLSFGDARSAAGSGGCSFKEIPSAGTSDLVLVSGVDSEVLSFSACDVVSFGSGSGDLSFGAASSDVSLFTAICSADISDLAIVSDGDSGVLYFCACCTVSMGGGSGDFSVSAAFSAAGSGGCSFNAAASAGTSVLALVSGSDSEVLSFSAWCAVSSGSGPGDISFGDASLSVPSFTAIRAADISDLAIVSGSASGVLSFSACGTVTFRGGSGDLSFGDTSSSVSSFTAICSVDTSDLAVVSGGGSGVFSISACGTVSFGSGSGDLSFGATSSSNTSFTATGADKSSDLVVVSCGDSGVLSFSAWDTVCFGGSSVNLSFSAAGSDSCPFKAIPSACTCDFALVSGGDSSREKQGLEEEEKVDLQTKRSDRRCNFQQSDTDAVNPERTPKLRFVLSAK
nr:unnamed protein product [Callosobruchus analis]